jgi:hypothetical protein
MKDKWNKFVSKTVCKLFGHKWVLISARYATCKRCGELAQTVLQEKKNY